MSLFSKDKLARREIESEHPLARLRHEVDDLFRGFFSEPWGMTLADAPFGRLGEWGPEMDISESEKELTLKFELPGVDSREVDISVSDNVLTLRGEKTEDKDEKNGAARYRERRYGAFSRSVTLPASVDPNKVDASFKNGVLTIKLQRRPEATPRKITVKTG